MRAPPTSMQVGVRPIEALQLWSASTSHSPMTSTIISLSAPRRQQPAAACPESLLVLS